jgi:hypothetical protein
MLPYNYSYNVPKSKINPWLNLLSCLGHAMKPMMLHSSTHNNQTTIRQNNILLFLTILMLNLEVAITTQ